MALTGQREHHPALILYLITVLLLCLAILLGFIALFVPWVQDDVAVGNRVFSYPFKTCYVQTFSPVHQQTCMDNDFIVGPKGAPLTGGNDTCKVFLLTAIAIGFCGIFGGFMVAISLVVLIVRLWSRPVLHAVVTLIFHILVPCCCVCCFSIFIAYAETTCHVKSIFPVHGYSYGFILIVFAAALSLSSVVTAFFALKKLRGYQLLNLDEEKEVYAEEQEAPSFNGTYEEHQWHPQAAPTPVHTTDSDTPVVLY